MNGQGEKIRKKEATILEGTLMLCLFMGPHQKSELRQREHKGHAKKKKWGVDITLDATSRDQTDGTKISPAP